MEIGFQRLPLVNLELKSRQKDDYERLLLRGREKEKYRAIWTILCIL